MPSDIDGHGMIGHTLEEYRGRGIHLWLLLKLIQMSPFVQLFGHAYGYIAASNTKSMRNANFIGAKVLDRKVGHFTLKANVKALL